MSGIFPFIYPNIGFLLYRGEGPPKAILHSPPMVYQRKEMSQYNLDEGGQVCEDCGLEDVELFGGLCEDCDNEMFATFWTGETDE